MCNLRFKVTLLLLNVTRLLFNVTLLLLNVTRLLFNVTQLFINVTRFLLNVTSFGRVLDASESFSGHFRPLKILRQVAIEFEVGGGGLKGLCGLSFYF